MKKVLIMVLSSNQEPYDRLMQSQKETWDTEIVPGVSTIYYYGDPSLDETIQKYKDIICNCSDIYEMMHWKYKLALDYCWDLEWDFIFRTNSSSYVNKQKLFDFIQTLSTTNCWLGKGNGIMSGAGFILSRDLAEFVNERLDSYETPSEDMCIATILSKGGYEVGEAGDRVEFNHYENKPERECYHYRCKSDTSDRNKDILAFNKLFNQFHK